MGSLSRGQADSGLLLAMISKFALASLAAFVAAEDISSLYPNTLYKRDGGSHSHSSSSSPSSGYGAPEPSYSAPSPSYSAPAPSYSQPSYEAPEPSYGAPQDSYGPPSTGYETPSYGTPSSSYGEASAGGGLDLTSILIPILALLGLSLLFPTFVTLSGGRRKREAGDDSPAANMVERVQDMYMALMESEECMERIACEVGGLAADAGISKNMTKMVEKFAPKKYAKMMKNFNHGKDCKKNNKCGLF